MGIENYNALCRGIVMKYSSEWEHIGNLYFKTAGLIFFSYIHILLKEVVGGLILRMIIKLWI